MPRRHMMQVVPRVDTRKCRSFRGRVLRRSPAVGRVGFVSRVGDRGGWRLGAQGGCGAAGRRAGRVGGRAESRGRIGERVGKPGREPGPDRGGGAHRVGRTAAAEKRTVQVAVERLKLGGRSAGAKQQEIRLESKARGSPRWRNPAKPGIAPRPTQKRPDHNETAPGNPKAKSARPTRPPAPTPKTDDHSAGTVSG
jgi:hypothetical protein